MALAWEIPMCAWYYDARNEWTLDYPPFFEYFEWFLAQIASWIDVGMLGVNNLYYCDRMGNASCVDFMRFSVVFTDLVFCYGVYRIC